MRIWPDMLPTPSKPGYKLAPVDPSRRTDMEVGAKRVRRMTRARRDTVDAQWRFTDAEMALFRAWYGDEPWSLAGDSEALTDWALTNATSVQDGIVGPSGQLADKIRASATNDLHHAARSLPGAAFNGVDLVVMATMSAGGNGVGRLGYADRAGVLRYADITLSTGAVAGQSGLSSVAVQDRGAGWWRLTATGTTGTGGLDPEMRVATLQAAGSPSFLGNGTSGIYVCEKMARLASGTDLFAMTDASGHVLGAAGGSAWVFLPLAFGGGLQTVEARFDAPFSAEAYESLRWGVSGRFEVRNA